MKRTAQRNPLASMLGPLALLFLASGAVAEDAAQPIEAVVYKSPSCGCCSKWVEHLEENGFQVETVESSDMNAVKKRLGVPIGLASCHTALVEDTYVVEGHVPAEDIRRLFESGAEAKGLAVPGMPGGSPGMESAPATPYEVILFDAEGNTEVYAEHGDNAR
ncbi:MAG TPA: DUF411 domain-containing protein [Woeseiaceae bacterium]|nr:DUF411 domain-containing protein [Woeseiaceae bacterium]